MKLLDFSLILFAVIISSASHSQTLWVTNGSNIVNNNPGGGVNIVHGFTTIPPGGGTWPLFSHGSVSHLSGTAPFAGGAFLLSLNMKSGTLTQSTAAAMTAGNESSGNGTVITAYAIRARVQAGLGTVNTGYGIYIEDIAATNDYGVYQAGTNDTNYFAGNIGVGTTNPGSFKLAVEGKIGAREVQVTITNPWPDYVFHEDYKLPPLTEVASFIKENKHLPEIPSAEDIKRDGHKLGEMDALLLKKVEELTLYVIELQKQVEELKRVNEDFEKSKKL